MEASRRDSSFYFVNKFPGVKKEATGVLFPSLLQRQKADRAPEKKQSLSKTMKRTFFCSLKDYLKKKGLGFKKIIPSEMEVAPHTQNS